MVDKELAIERRNFKSIKENLSALSAEIIAELAQTARETADAIRQFDLSTIKVGDVQLLFVEGVANEAMARDDLRNEERQSLMEDLQIFRSEFAKIVQSDGKYESDAIFRAIETALFIGRASGVTSERLHEIRQAAGLAANSVRQAMAGRASGEKRRERRKWEPHATELIHEICRQPANWSYENIALEVNHLWKLTEHKCPCTATLKKLIKELEHSGKIRRKVGK